MANISESGVSDFAVQIAPGVSESGTFDTPISPTVSVGGLFDTPIAPTVSGSGPLDMLLLGLQAVRTKQILGFDLTESALSFADKGDNTGGSWTTTWKRARVNSGGTAYWDIELDKGTYLVIVSVVGQMAASDDGEAFLHVGLATDATGDDNTGIIVNSVQSIPIPLRPAADSSNVFGGTHAYVQTIASDSTALTVKRLLSDVTDVTVASSLSKIDVGSTHDGLLVDGSVIRAYRIGQ